MPDDELTPATTDPVAAAPPPPTFVPTDDFKKFQESMAGTLGQIVDRLEGLAAVRAAAPAAAPEARITEAQYDDAIREGNGPVIRAYHQQEMEVFRRGHVEPLSTTGLTAVTELSKVTFLGTKPHYRRFQKEIDARLAQLPPQALANPRAYEIAYDSVVGSHAHELVAEAEEAARRQAAAGPADTVPAGASGRGKATPSDVPSVQDFLGQDAAVALQEKGMDGDAFARRLGYRGGWAEYVKVANESEEAMTRGRR